MTQTFVRTYATGDPVESYVYGPLGEWCGVSIDGSYRCSIRRGHEGPQHVACNGFRVVAVADRVPQAEAAVQLALPDGSMVDVPLAVRSYVRALQDSARADLEPYKIRVRDVAIRVAGEQGWCDEGLNSVLRELDLEPHKRSWRVEVRLSQEVTVTVEAADADAARSAVEGMTTPTLLGKAGEYDWEVEYLNVETDD